MNSRSTDVGGMPFCSVLFIPTMYERNFRSLRLSGKAGDVGGILLRSGSAYVFKSGSSYISDELNITSAFS